MSEAIDPLERAKASRDAVRAYHDKVERLIDDQLAQSRKHDNGYGKACYGRACFLWANLAHAGSVHPDKR